MKPDKEAVMDKRTETSSKTIKKLTTFLGSSAMLFGGGNCRFDPYFHSPMPSMTAGKSKYAPVRRQELSEEEKTRNADIDAKNAMKKAARKVAEGEH